MAQSENTALSPEAAGGSGQSESLAGRFLGSLQRSRDFRVYWTGNQASTFTMQMQQVARGYLAYALTGSATALGIVSLASGLPMLVVSPFAGVVADRVPRRNLLIGTQSILCVISVIMGALVQTGLIQWWHLVISGGIQGILFAFIMPARQAFIPSMVSDEDLPNAIALNNAGMNASRILGPAVAGLLIAVPFVGVKGIYYFRAIAYVIVLWTLLMIPIDDTPSKVGRRPFKRDLASGISYIAKSERLLPLFLLAAVVLTLGMGYQVLMPVFALSVLKVGPSGLGFLTTAAGVGALTGSLSMAYLSNAPNKARIQMFAGLALGLGIVAFCLSAAAGLYVAALGFLVIVGLANDFYSTINNTLILVNCDRALYGRVMSVYMMTWSIAPMAGAAIAAAADQVGASMALGTAGVVVVAVTLAVGLFYPAYRRIG